MKIASIPIICFIHIVSVIGRIIFRSNFDNLEQGSSGANLKNKTSFQFVPCFLLGGDWWGFFWGVGSAIKDQTNTVTNINNIFRI